MATALPGTATWAFDESTFVWNIWYFKHALLDLRTSPLHSELIWYPLGIDLILYTYNFFNALIALPLLLAFNLPAGQQPDPALRHDAERVRRVSAGVLRAACASSCRRGRKRRDAADAASRFTHHVLHLAAFLAGLIYAFASNRAIYAALGHYDMVTTQWLPFYALYLLKTLREPKLKNAVLAGLLLRAGRAGRDDLCVVPGAASPRSSCWQLAAAAAALAAHVGRLALAAGGRAADLGARARARSPASS